MIKSAQAGKMTFADKNNVITKDYEKLGSKILVVPPLLDPDLKIDEAKRLHQESTNPKEAETFNYVDAEDTDEVKDLKRRKIMENLCDAFPTVPSFIPTSAVM